MYFSFGTRLPSNILSNGAFVDRNRGGAEAGGRDSFFIKIHGVVTITSQRAWANAASRVLCEIHIDVFSSWSACLVYYH